MVNDDRLEAKQAVLADHLGFEAVCPPDGEKHASVVSQRRDGNGLCVYHHANNVSILKEKIMKRKTKRMICIFSIIFVYAATGAFSGCVNQKARVQTEAQENGGEPSLAQIPVPQIGNSAKIYFTTDISPAGLMAMYETWGVKQAGRWR
ncbi:MAG: hypothetical protein LBE17_01660 [Treponema sp.]|nr:hypothetical protein [Treponema sp.]